MVPVDADTNFNSNLHPFSIHLLRDDSVLSRMNTRRSPRLS